MPILNAMGLSLVDIVILLIILVGLPLEALLTLKKSRADLASGDPDARIRHYSQTILLLWSIALPIIVLWAASRRGWAELGFRIESSPIALAGWVLAGLVAVFFVCQFSMVAGSDKVREQIRTGLSRDAIMANFMPQNRSERQVFNLMGVTAGITEEIIFRGYLIWAFNLFMPVWTAALAALVVFTFLHLYQGVQQLPAIFMMGALVTLVFVLSGSLWPAIALHIFVDVINNQTIWKARFAPA